MKNAIIYFTIFLTHFTVCQAQEVTSFLIGTWKVEGRESYETWKKNSEGQLNGQSYKIKNGERLTTETLVIYNSGDQLMYEATVSGQNDEKAVSFTLNKNIENHWSFENPNHDFPTKIIYQKKEKNKLFVQVLGPDGKGFSFFMIRQ